MLFRSGPDAFSNCSKLNSIKLPNSLKVIGSRAFRFCSSLVSIRIPESTISIGHYDCYNRMLNDYDRSIIESDPILSKDSINPNEFIIAHVTFDNPFFRCSALEKIEVADGNKVFDSRNGCNALIETSSNTILHGCKSTIIPETVISIGDYAFDGCSELSSIIFPKTVRSIGNYAFSGCSNIKQIDLPSSLEYIGRAAFSYCDLYEIIIPRSVSEIGHGAFYDNNNIKSIIVVAGNHKYDSRNHCNAIIETSTNTLIYGCSNTVIPSSVTSIGEEAFYYCKGLTSIEIPSMVKSIGPRAFSKCDNLTSVKMLGSINTIGDGAFRECKKDRKSTRLNSSH